MDVLKETAKLFAMGVISGSGIAYIIHPELDLLMICLAIVLSMFLVPLYCSKL